MMMSCQESGNLTASLCDLNFCFRKGDIYLFTMPAVTWNTAVVRTINIILAMRVSWSDVTSHQSSIAWSTWLGVAEGRTLKLDFVVKKWQDQKIIFGILIYALCRFQNYKNPVGHIDTLRFSQFTVTIIIIISPYHAQGKDSSLDNVINNNIAYLSVRNRMNQSSLL